VADEPDQPQPGDGVPQPPWLEGTRRSSRARPTLSRETIVEAALRVLDQDGAAGFSMRRLADELGSGAGAVYWHVANKEQLLQLVFDRVIGELPLPAIEPERWEEQVKQAGRDARELMRRHPGIAQLSFGRIPLGPNAIRYLEWQLSLLRSGGLSDEVAALAGDLLALYLGAFAYEESLGFEIGDEPTSVEDFIGRMREYFASLPADRFPNIAALASELTAGDLDERFEFGLDVLVAGLVAVSER
jgi:TetR/AcrR family transcriptional regulator, tetracycline repressor protein